MLDKLGLDKKDGEGYRLRTDGGGRLRLELTTYLGFLPFTQIAEMVGEQWKKIGIGATVQELERSLAHRAHARQRAPDLLRDPVGRRQHVRPHPVVLPHRRQQSDSARSTASGSQRREPGQGAAAADAELMDKYREVVRRAGRRSGRGWQGGLEDRARRAVDDPAWSRTHPPRRACG